MGFHPAGIPQCITAGLRSLAQLTNNVTMENPFRAQCDMCRQNGLALVNVLNSIFSLNFLSMHSSLLQF